jgi:hypothetical protein
LFSIPFPLLRPLAWAIFKHVHRVAKSNYFFGQVCPPVSPPSALMEMCDCRRTDSSEIL